MLCFVQRFSRILNQDGQKDKQLCSAGPCHRTYGQFWNELLEHQLLPRRYHAWYCRRGERSRDENDDGSSLPLSYNKLVERYPHAKKDHLVKLLKQLLLNVNASSEGVGDGSVTLQLQFPLSWGLVLFRFCNVIKLRKIILGKLVEVSLDIILINDEAGEKILNLEQKYSKLRKPIYSKLDMYVGAAGINPQRLKPKSSVTVKQEKLNSN